MDNHTVIDIEELRKNKSDSLPYHIWSIAIDCKFKKNSYWRFHNNLKFKSNLISLPLLITSTASGFFSVSQLNGNNEHIAIFLTTISIITAILASLQKLFRYSERAENAKDMAKNYARLARKIENTMVLIESDAVKMQPDEFIKFINDVQIECDLLLQETNEIPTELITEKNEYIKQLDKLNQIKLSYQNRNNSSDHIHISNQL